MNRRIEQIQSRLDAATKGKWLRDNSADPDGANFTENVTVGAWDVAICPGGNTPPEGGRREQAANDADFIANAPSDITYLLESIRVLKALQK